jgi:hypothetical protein
MKKKELKPMRARRTKAKGKDSPTAAAARKSRAATVPRTPERRPVVERWGTMAQPSRPGGVPSFCIWGTQEDAFLGRDPDEQVVLLRIEVLEVLDEGQRRT